MKITLITACFNSEATIRHTLASAASQRDVDFDHIIVDGGSTDGTLEMLKDFSHLTSVVSEPDAGIYDALNKGVRRSAGDLIGFLHSDDFLASDTTLAQIASAAMSEQISGVYGDLEYVDRSDPSIIIRRWRAGEYRRRSVRWGWMPPHPTLYVRRQFFEHVGFFNLTYRIAADYDWFLRLNSTDPKLVYIPQTLVKMRTGGASNSSLKALAAKSSEDLKAMRSNHVGGILSLAAKNFRKIPQWF